jgi:hypothetical protein
MESFPRFTELPLELQLEILEVHPEALRRTGRVSPTIRQLARTSLARHYCWDPISQREFYAYLATRPTEIGIWRHILTPNDTLFENYRFIPNSDSCFLFQSDVSMSNHGHRVDVRFEWENDITGDIQGEFWPCSSIEWEPTMGLDFETHYQILSRRRPCIEYDPNYARTRVLENLDNIYNQKASERVVDVCHVFLSFANNALILGTPTVPPSIHYRFTADNDGLLDPDHQIDEDHYNQLLALIEDMYGEMREYFLGPDTQPTELTRESLESETDKSDGSADDE